MDDIDPSYYKGMELIFQGRHDEAESLLRDALERDSENVELLCDLGLVYETLKQPSELRVKKILQVKMHGSS
jgi:Flp pilus assembly protein TadD